MRLTKLLLISIWCGVPMFATASDDRTAISPETLRTLYSDQSTWPTIQTADGHAAAEMAPLTLIGEAPKPEQVALGKKLFFDPQLSKDGSVSCASCHEPRMQFGDRRTTAIGIRNQEGTRNTPNIFGMDHWQSFFWDGRAISAEQQALMPISNPIEMDFTPAEALQRINEDASYREYIQKAFGSVQPSSDLSGPSTEENPVMTESQMAKALVAFERTIKLPETKYSRFLARIQAKSKEPLAEYSDQEVRGLHLFRTKAKCMTCHQGPLLSDNRFHVTGLHFYGRKFEDVGRYEATNKVEDSGKFRTASLLFVSQTGPWMHNGLFSQFDGIVNFYNNGGARPKPREHVKDDPMFPTTTHLLPKLELTKQEIKDVVAFLKTL